MECVILDQDGFSVELPEALEKALLKAALRPDETGFSTVRGAFVQEGVTLFLVCRIGDTETHRLRFALVKPEALGSEELLDRYHACEGLTTHEELLNMIEAAVRVSAPDPKTLN